jgi:hypothetical protein
MLVTLLLTLQILCVFQGLLSAGLDPDFLAVDDFIDGDGQTEIGVQMVLEVAAILDLMVVEGAGKPIRHLLVKLLAAGRLDGIKCLDSGRGGRRLLTRLKWMSNMLWVNESMPSTSAAERNIKSS